MSRKLTWGALALAVLAVGGYFGAERYAETRMRERIDAELAAAELAGHVTYGEVKANLFDQGGTVRDIVLTEDGVPVWRIDRATVRKYETDAKGHPLRVVTEVSGVHLDFPGWDKACREKGVACDYNPDDGNPSPDEVIADADIDYRMDDAAKTMQFRYGVTLRGLIEVGLAGTVTGLDTAALTAASESAKGAMQSGLPPAMVSLIVAADLGRNAERIAVSDFRVAMRDLGGLRRQAERRARAEGDARPPEALVAEDLDAAQAALRDSAQAWVPKEFTAAMADALKPFALEGKPYRIGAAEGAPVALFERGPTGSLGLAPGLTDVRALFDALHPSVGNAPL